MCAVTLGATAAPAQAQSAYRYWSYWSVQDGAWTFATMGPASAVPADGAVEGWHFVVTSAQGTAKDAPKAPAATVFEEVCADTAPVSGRKRVALIVDFGLPKDAPAMEHQPVGIASCVVADPEASGYEILAAQADIRVEDGLVCGIDSYPLTECAAVVDPAAQQAQTPGAITEQLAPVGGSSGSGALVSGLTLLVLAALGYLVWRRRRRP